MHRQSTELIHWSSDRCHKRQKRTSERYRVIHWRTWHQVFSKTDMSFHNEDTGPSPFFIWTGVPLTHSEAIVLFVPRRGHRAKYTRSETIFKECMRDAGFVEAPIGKYVVSFKVWMDRLDIWGGDYLGFQACCKLANGRCSTRVSSNRLWRFYAPWKVQECHWRVWSLSQIPRYCIWIFQNELSSNSLERGDRTLRDSDWLKAVEPDWRPIYIYRERERALLYILDIGGWWMVWKKKKERKKKKRSLQL